MDDDGFYMAELRGQRGLVPYLKINLVRHEQRLLPTGPERATF